MHQQEQSLLQKELTYPPPLPSHSFPNTGGVDVLGNRLMLPLPLPLPPPPAPSTLLPSPPAPLYPPLHPQPSLHYHSPGYPIPSGNYPPPHCYTAMMYPYPWLLAPSSHAQYIPIQYPVSPVEQEKQSLLSSPRFMGGVIINNGGSGNLMRLENNPSVTSLSEKLTSATILKKSPGGSEATLAPPPPASATSSSSSSNASLNITASEGIVETRPAQKLEITEISKRIRKEIPKNGICYYCEWKGCQVQFTTLSALRFHVEEIHVGRRKSYYACEWSCCGENELTFFKRYEAIMHIRSHIGTRPFGCPFPHCNRWFTRADALLVHERSAHGGQSPRYCDAPGCNAVFTSHIDLKRHRKSVHKLYYVFG